MSIFVSCELSIFQNFIVTKSEEYTHALTTLFGIRFVENIGKQVVVLDSERTSFEVIGIAHEVNK